MLAGEPGRLGDLAADKALDLWVLNADVAVGDDDHWVAALPGLFDGGGERKVEQHRRVLATAEEHDRRPADFHERANGLQ
jgi:hypothetical protein